MRNRRLAWLAVVAFAFLMPAVPVWAQGAPPDLDKLEKQINAAKAAEAAKAAKAAGARKPRPTKKPVAASEESSSPAAPSAGRVFHDRLGSGGSGPEMVVIPAGRFMMGSPSYEVGRDTDEGPQHEVSVRHFAMGKYPVTKAEYAAFVSATGYQTDAEKNTPFDGKTASAGCFAYQGGTSLGWKAGTSWRDPGFPQDDSHPVTCLSWNDAVAYAEWLRATTGKSYRLPSEAESEYATRAGSTDRYPWGADAEQACQYANGADASLKQQIPDWKFPTLGCSDGYAFTSPVGRFKANAFGLYDTIGNVYKWTQDCGPDIYANAPTNGAANVSNGCELRVFSGGSWGSGTAYLRSASRVRGTPAFRSTNFGLRVAQDL